jgi:hypothetical protein
MEHIIGLITLPLLILLALCLIAGIKPDVFVKAFFSLFVAILTGLLTLLGVTVKSIAGNSASKPRPRYRDRATANQD